MKKDKILQELLIKGAVDVSPGFTENVMKLIEAIDARKVYSVSVINKKWKLVYLIAFVAISVSIITFSLLVKTYELPFVDHFRMPAINEELSYKLILCILSFWILIFINQWINNKSKRKILG